MKQKTNKAYSYPALSNRDYGWIRIGGPGLANCMFFAAKAYIYSRLHDAVYIEPTWRKLSIGPWIRHEKDKRIYNKLFYSKGVSGLSKFLIIKGLLTRKKNIVTFSELGNYFQDINQHYNLVKELFDQITRPQTIVQINEEKLSDLIAIHVRLGDYIPELRIDISWYKEIVTNILKINPNQQFALFSDGKQEELAALLQISNVKRMFFGNAFADIYAISKCKMLIASDSTFSAWGAFLGQKPILFSRRHFPSVYSNNIPEMVLGTSATIPAAFETIINTSQIR